MSRWAAHHSSPSTSTQVAPILPATLEPRVTSDWCPSRNNKSLPPLPEQHQQNEVFNVWTLDLDDDERVTIKYLNPKRCVGPIEEPEMAKAEHAIVEELMGDFRPPYPMCSSVVFGQYEEDTPSQGRPSPRLLSHDLSCPLDKLELIDETDCNDSTSLLPELTESCTSPVIRSTTVSSSTGQPLHECLSPPGSSRLGHTRLRDQFSTHAASQSPGPELGPSSLAPCGTMGLPPRMNAIDGRTARRTPPPATTVTRAGPTRTSSQTHKPKPKPKPNSRPLIDLEFAGYKPRCGPSPLLADQATAQDVYRATKQHISDQLKSHRDWNGHLESTRATERQQARIRVQLAAMNAEAAQDLRAAEQASGIALGQGRGNGERGRGFIRRPVYDNSAWGASLNGHSHHHRSSSLT